MASTRDKLRLQIGDIDTGNALFSDEELDIFLADNTAETVVNLNLAAADACEALANRFAREYDFEEGGQSFRRSQRSAAYRAQAQQLRHRAGGGSVPLVSSVNAAQGDNLPAYGT